MMAVILTLPEAGEQCVDITESLQNGIYTVTLNGKFTFFDQGSFRGILEEIANQEVKKILFDVSRLSFVDSSGLGQFLLAHDKAEEHKKSLSIQGANGQVKKMFSIAHFETIFTLLE